MATHNIRNFTAFQQPIGIDAVNCSGRNKPLTGDRIKHNHKSVKAIVIVMEHIDRKRGEGRFGWRKDRHRAGKFVPLAFAILVIALIAVIFLVLAYYNG